MPPSSITSVHSARRSSSSSGCPASLTIRPFMATSSFGCLIFDAAIAAWFIAGAPAIPRRAR